MYFQIYNESESQEKRKEKNVSINYYLQSTKKSFIESLTGLDRLNNKLFWFYQTIYMHSIK